VNSWIKGDNNPWDEIFVYKFGFLWENLLGIGFRQKRILKFSSLRSDWTEEMLEAGELKDASWWQQWGLGEIWDASRERIQFSSRFPNLLQHKKTMLCCATRHNTPRNTICITTIRQSAAIRIMCLYLKIIISVTDGKFTPNMCMLKKSFKINIGWVNTKHVHRAFNARATPIIICHRIRNSLKSVGIRLKFMYRTMEHRM
jgi:hypothetical protein